MTYCLMASSVNILLPQKHMECRPMLNKSIEPHNNFKDT